MITMDPWGNHSISLAWRLRGPRIIRGQTSKDPPNGSSVLDRMPVDIQTPCRSSQLYQYDVRNILGRVWWIKKSANNSGFVGNLVLEGSGAWE